MTDVLFQDLGTNVGTCRVCIADIPVVVSGIGTHVAMK